MVKKRRVIGAFLVVLLWLVSFLAILATQGFFPYFLDPDRAVISVNATTEHVNTEGTNLELAGQKAVFTIEMNTNFSLEAISTIVVRDFGGPVLVLTPGSTETFVYMAKDWVTLARMTLSVENASLSLVQASGEQLINFSHADAVDLVAGYSPEDPIPVILSRGATIRIASIEREFGFLYIWPQDLLKTRMLFRITRFGDRAIATCSLSFNTQSIQANVSCAKCALYQVDGSVGTNTIHELRGYDTIDFKAPSSDADLNITGPGPDLAFEVVSTEFLGQLWINGIPTPPSSSETYLRSGIAAGCGVTATVITVYLKDILFPPKSPKVRSTRTGASTRVGKA